MLQKQKQKQKRHGDAATPEAFLLGAAAGARGDPPLILGCGWNPRVCDAPTLAGSGGLFAFATWGAELHATLWRFNGTSSARD